MYIASIHSSDQPVDISFDQTKSGAVQKAREKLSKRMGIDLNEVEGFFLFEDETLSVELMQTVLTREEIEQRLDKLTGVDELANLMVIFEAELCCQA